MGTVNAGLRMPGGVTPGGKAGVGGAGRTGAVGTAGAGGSGGRTTSAGERIETLTPCGAGGAGRTGGTGTVSGGAPGVGTLNDGEGMPQDTWSQVAAESFEEPGVGATSGTVDETNDPGAVDVRPAMCAASPVLSASMSLVVRTGSPLDPPAATPPCT